jgi:TP901 family phage tail tape measure protein
LLAITRRSISTSQAEVAGIQERTRVLENLSKPSLRYALYDVSQTLRRAAVAFAAFSAVPIGFAIKYEREFANVIRTNELAADSADTTREELKSALRDIGQATPIPWKDITNIATLAGQLGIAQDLVAGFTDTVAKFSATTDLSVDAAATGFGRLNQLIDGVDGQFEELGSAILAVGVDSVATESAIVNVSTNIASMGNLAGLSASDIVGLSGAIASLGIRPELARGNITRLFSNINKSVALSGYNLEEYGRLTGRTAEQFAEAWSSEPTEVLLDFFQGIAREGAGAERTLRDLGITSVRDIPAILRLAQSQDEVRRLIGVSNDAFAEGTKITEQYGVIAGTTAEEIRRLGQNFQTLGASIGEGSGILNFLPQFISLLNSATVGVSDFFATNERYGKPLSGFIIAASATLSILFALGSALALATAGFSALLFTSRSLGINITAFGVRALVTGQTLETLALKAGITEARFKALRATTIRTTLVLAAISAAVAALGFAYDYQAQRQERLRGLTNDLIDSNLDLKKSIQEDTEAYKESGEAIEVYRKFTDRSVESMQSSVDATGELSGGLKEISASGSDASQKLESFVAVGDKVVQSLLEQAAASENFASILESPALSQLVTQQFGGPAGFFGTALQDSDKIRERLVQLRQEAVNLQAASQIGPTRFLSFLIPSSPEIDRIDSLVEFLDDIDSIANDDGLRQIAEDAEIMAQRMALADGQVREFADGLFASINKTKAAEDAVGEFYAALEDGEDVVDVSNEKFQSLITSIAATGDPQQAIANLLAIQEDLAQKGLLTAAVSEILSSALIDLALAGKFANTALEVTPELLAEIGSIGASILPGINADLTKYTETTRGAAEATKTLAEEFEELTRSIFDPVNAAQDAAESIFDLAVAYTELGDDAFYASDEIQDAVSNILDSSSSAEEGVANLNALYARLAQTVGSDTAPSLVFLRSVIDQVAQEFGVAQEAVAGFANIDLGFFESGLRDVQEEVRTLLDYAGDLDNVISRAFDIRFASTFAIDNIAEAWFDLTSQVEDAQYAVEELIATQQDLGADRALKEYFLSVADAYGDTVRAAQLRKEIADLDREQARNARELVEAQQIAGGDLTTQGPGARQNRAALLGLVREYQDYITTLAESGATQEELTEATEDARREFIRQARELGFQEDVVLQYAEAFDDVRTAIDRVPRDITIDFNANPALQALNELNAKLNESINLASRLNQVQGQPTPAPGPGTGPSTTPSAGVASDAALRAALGARPEQSVIRGRLVGPSGGPAGETAVQANRIGRVDIRTQEVNLPGALFRGVPTFASGGYTGSGGKYQPAGIVHRGEYVVPKQYVNQSTGMPDPSFLAQLQNGMRGYANGGFVGGGGMGGDAMMVELSPYDRKLLENAGNVQLRVDGKVVASATNRSNFNEARRGSN